MPKYILTATTVHEIDSEENLRWALEQFRSAGWRAEEILKLENAGEHVIVDDVCRANKKIHMRSTVKLERVEDYGCSPHRPHRWKTVRTVDTPDMPAEFIQVCEYCGEEKRV